MEEGECKFQLWVRYEPKHKADYYSATYAHSTSGLGAWEEVGICNPLANFGDFWS